MHEMDGEGDDQKYAMERASESSRMSYFRCKALYDRAKLEAMLAPFSNELTITILCDVLRYKNAIAYGNGVFVAVDNIKVAAFQMGRHAVKLNRKLSSSETQPSSAVGF